MHGALAEVRSGVPAAAERVAGIEGAMKPVTPSSKWYARPDAGSPQKGPSERRYGHGDSAADPQVRAVP